MSTSVVEWLQNHPLVLPLLGLASRFFEPSRWRKFVASLLVGLGAVLFYLPLDSGNLLRWTLKALGLSAVFIYTFWSGLDRIFKWGSRFLSRRALAMESQPTASDLGQQFLEVASRAIGTSTTLQGEYRTNEVQMTISTAPFPTPPSGTRDVVNRIGQGEEREANAPAAHSAGGEAPDGTADSQSLPREGSEDIGERDGT